MNKLYEIVNEELEGIPFEVTDASDEDNVSVCVSFEGVGLLVEPCQNDVMVTHTNQERFFCALTDLRTKILDWYKLYYDDRRADYVAKADKMAIKRKRLDHVRC